MPKMFQNLLQLQKSFQEDTKIPLLYIAGPIYPKNEILTHFFIMRNMVVFEELFIEEIEIPR